jgi:Doubled CXXCH motif (Paired_CXXCH_1)/Tetratricopeptide repeat
MNPGCSIFRLALTVWMVTTPFLSAAPGESVRACAACHAKETTEFLKSPMGNSLASPSPLAGGHVARENSGLEISISDREGRMIHSLSTKGLTAEFPVAYQIGAGKIGYTYMVRIGDYLYESPASWYRQHGWDTSPGYERTSSPDFDRLIDSACLFCHADNGKFVGSDGRRFSGVVLNPIGCDRCHGSGEDHIRQPSAKNIVNPSRLPQRARDSVCEQCHLEGERRLLNPGKTWQDFHPGDELERTAVIYMLTQNNQQVKAVGQAEQLALSRCVRASAGKLWCATCHNPHGQAADRTSQIRDVCKSCHPTLSKASHAAVTECVSCHMPRLTPEDIPHTASTDHRILRRRAPLPNAENSGAEITAWQDPPAQFRARDLAVAALVIGGTHGLGTLRDTGVQLLEALPQREKENDPEVLSSLVSIRLQLREMEQAREFARRAAEVQPDSGFASLNLALALQNSGDDAGAERQLLHTIDLDPSLQPAWINLVFLYEKLGRQSDRIAILDRYLKWNPQNIWFRQLKAMLPQQH